MPKIHVAENPTHLCSTTLADVVRRIQSILWLEDLGAERSFWDVNKEWNSDTVSDIADVLTSEGLQPKLVDAIGPFDFRVTMHYQDAEGNVATTHQGGSGTFSAMTEPDAIECAQDAWADPRVEAFGFVPVFEVHRVLKGKNHAAE